MSKKPIYDTDPFDFGFTAVSEKDVAAGLVNEATSESQLKVQKMYNMILPLLQNLKKDADTQEYIFWPNRAEKIDEFITILDKLVKS